MPTGRPKAAAKTAFVFAGGGSLGAIQVGALRELIAAGERPDFVVGSSVGALNACFFAARPDQAGVAALEAIWRNLRRHDVFPLGWRGVMRWFRGGDSLFEPLALRRLIERDLPLAKLEDAAIPVHVVATNLSGAPVVLSQGPVVEAVLASSAIPIAFPSVRIGMDHLMDGAIAGNTPLLTAAELGAERIIVLQTGYACSMDGPPQGAVARGMHALTLLISNQMERDFQLLDGKVCVQVSPHLCPLDVSPFDFTQAAELIERAAANMRAWIAEGGLDRPSTTEGVAHEHAGMSNKNAAQQQT
jgi:NTE family protein